MQRRGLKFTLKTRTRVDGMKGPLTRIESQDARAVVVRSRLEPVAVSQRSTAGSVEIHQGLAYRVEGCRDGLGVDHRALWLRPSPEDSS